MNGIRFNRLKNIFADFVSGEEQIERKGREKFKRLKAKDQIDTIYICTMKMEDRKGYLDRIFSNLQIINKEKTLTIKRLEADIRFLKEAREELIYLNKLKREEEENGEEDV